MWLRTNNHQLLPASNDPSVNGSTDSVAAAAHATVPVALALTADTDSAMNVRVVHSDEIDLLRIKIKDRTKEGRTKVRTNKDNRDRNKLLSACY